MLRITVDVNGRGIGQVAAVRRDSSIKSENVYDIYNVSDVSPGESVVDEELKLGEVTHSHEDGAAKLTALVMEEIESLPN